VARTFRLTLACAATALSLGVAVRGEPAVVAGMGTYGCAALNAHTAADRDYRQNDVAIAAFSWIQGYLSAWNTIGIVGSGRFADLRSITIDEQWSFVAGFCRSNPDRFVFDAARAILATRLTMQSVPPTALRPDQADPPGE
jgi:hypothetical protein